MRSLGKHVAPSVPIWHLGPAVPDAPLRVGSAAYSLLPQCGMPTADKIWFIDALVAAGISNIEIAKLRVAHARPGARENRRSALPRLRKRSAPLPPRG